VLFAYFVFVSLNVNIYVNISLYLWPWYYNLFRILYESLSCLLKMYWFWS